MTNIIEDSEDSKKNNPQEEDLSTKITYVLLDDENKVYDEAKGRFSKIKAYAEYLEKEGGVKLTIKTKKDYLKEIGE